MADVPLGHHEFEELLGLVLVVVQAEVPAGVDGGFHAAVRDTGILRLLRGDLMRVDDGFLIISAALSTSPEVFA